MKKLSMDELGRIDADTFKQMEKANFVVVMDNVRSMHNIGSAFRTADAFNAEKLYLVGISAQPPHREIHKTALGATESVAWEYWEEAHALAAFLKENGYVLCAAEQTDRSIALNDFVFDPSLKYAFVFGNEVDGVCQGFLDLTDHALEIPQFGTKHSLNVSVALGVILWEASKNLLLPKRSEA